MLQTEGSPSFGLHAASGFFDTAGPHKYVAYNVMKPLVSKLIVSLISNCSMLHKSDITRVTEMKDESVIGGTTGKMHEHGDDARQSRPAPYRIPHAIKTADNHFLPWPGPSSSSARFARSTQAVFQL